MAYYHRTQRKRTLSDRIFDHFEAILGLGVIAVIGGLVFLAFWTTHNWVNTEQVLYNCMVSEKESVRKEKTHEYRVYTENCGVLTVKDEAWLGLYNSADTYAKIDEDRTYTFNTVGWRNGFFSTFPNIVKVIG